MRPSEERATGSTEPRLSEVTRSPVRCQCTTVGPRLLQTASSAVKPVSLHQRGQGALGGLHRVEALDRGEAQAQRERAEVVARVGALRPPGRSARSSPGSGARRSGRGRRARRARCSASGPPERSSASSSGTPVSIDWMPRRLGCCFLAIGLLTMHCPKTNIYFGEGGGQHESVLPRGSRCAVALCCIAASCSRNPARRSASACTLSLTGPLAAPGAIQKVAGEVYVEDLNKRGGLLGRKVEWVLKDDQSRPDVARTLYEQLVTVDKVDLIIGPYGTANILSAMGVAQRYNKILLHNSFGTPRQAKYDMQFSDLGRRGRPRERLAEPGAQRGRLGAQAAEDASPSSPASSRRCTSSRWARAKWRRSAASRRCCSWNTSSATATSARSPAA